MVFWEFGGLLGFKGICSGLRGSFWEKKLLRKMFETLRLCSVGRLPRTPCFDTVDIHPHSGCSGRRQEDLHP